MESVFVRNERSVRAEASQVSVSARERGIRMRRDVIRKEESGKMIADISSHHLFLDTMWRPI
jgi:hypothetical protein